MPSLLSPAFLTGLLAIAVPILVHLRMRERRTAQPFPSLMFVRRIPHKSLRRRTLQNLLLFAARTLALVLLCLAFARPFFPVQAGDQSLPTRPVGRVIALDVSASMRYAGVFPRAVAEAERAVREVRSGDAVGVLLFSDQAQGVAPPSTDHGKALAAIRSASPGQRSTRFAPALRLAADWLGALKADRREVILVTDGQTRALAGVSEVAMPAGTSVSVRSVAAPAPDNSAVAAVSIENVEEAERSFAVVTARLVHQGASERRLSATLRSRGAPSKSARSSSPRVARPPSLSSEPRCRRESRRRAFSCKPMPSRSTTPFISPSGPAEPFASSSSTPPPTSPAPWRSAISLRSRFSSDPRSPRETSPFARWSFSAITVRPAPGLRSRPRWPISCARGEASSSPARPPREGAGT